MAPEKTTKALNRWRPPYLFTNPTSPLFKNTSCYRLRYGAVEEHHSSESEEIVDKKNVTDSESEEDSEEQSGDEDEEEGEKTIAQIKAQLQTQNQKPQSSSGDDNSSGSESDSDSRERTPSPTVSAFAVKPISSKPMDKPQKPTPKLSAPEPKPGTKRPAKVQNGNGNGNDGSSKNKKMKVEEDKKNYRLWSEDDVVAIMKGVLDFKSKRGADAFGDMGAFYEFVKNEFTVAVTKNQLWDKARRLKKKYQAILEAIIEKSVNGKGVNGEDPVFQKPVEHKCYQLSKKIWGTDSLEEGSSSKNPPGRKKKAKKATTTKPSNSLASPLPLASPKALPLPEKYPGRKKATTTKPSNSVASPKPLPLASGRKKKKATTTKPSNSLASPKPLPLASGRKKKKATTTKPSNSLASPKPLPLASGRKKKKATTTKPSNSLASPKPLPLASPKSLPLPEKKSNGVVEDGKPVEDDFYSMFPALKGSLEAKDLNLSVPEAVVNALKYTMPLIGTVNAKELEERWKNLGAEQTRLFLKQLDLVREQTKMALDAMESSKQ